MKKILLICGCLLFATDAFAVTIQGEAIAIIKSVLSVTKGEKMDFGTITSNTTGGAVTLSHTGVRNATAGFDMYGTSKQATFTIKGEPLTALTVTLADGTLNSGGGANMIVDTFTTSPDIGAVNTDASGDVTLNVGADLNVGANQASGTYEGTYGLTLSY